MGSGPRGVLGGRRSQQVSGRGSSSGGGGGGAPGFASGAARCSGRSCPGAVIPTRRTRPEAARRPEPGTDGRLVCLPRGRFSWQLLHADTEWRDGPRRRGSRCPGPVCAALSADCSAPSSRCRAGCSRCGAGGGRRRCLSVPSGNPCGRSYAMGSGHEGRVCEEQRLSVLSRRPAGCRHLPRAGTLSCVPLLPSPRCLPA